MTIPVELSVDTNLITKLKEGLGIKVCDEIQPHNVAMLCRSSINQIISVETEDPVEFVQIVLDTKNLLKNFTLGQLDTISSLCHAGSLISYNDTIQCLRKFVDVLSLRDDNDDIEDCHELLSEYNPILDSCKFWLEGISLRAIAVFGLCGNTLAIIVLGRTKDSNRSDHLK